MARNPASTDFPLDVPGIGTFMFARRMLRDELRIAAEFSRLTEGVETPTEWLQFVGTWMSTLKVLTVSAPGGWDIDAMDPLDPETYGRLGMVYAALREKEESFRPGANKAVQAPGTGGGDVSGVLVSGEVQPAAD